MLGAHVVQEPLLVPVPDGDQTSAEDAGEFRLGRRLDHLLTLRKDLPSKTVGFYLEICHLFIVMSKFEINKIISSLSSVSENSISRVER